MQTSSTTSSSGRAWLAAMALGCTLLAPKLAAADDQAGPRVVDFVGDLAPADGHPRSSYMVIDQLGLTRPQTRRTPRASTPERSAESTSQSQRGR